MGVTLELRGIEQFRARVYITVRIVYYSLDPPDPPFPESFAWLKAPVLTYLAVENQLW